MQEQQDRDEQKQIIEHLLIIAKYVKNKNEANISIVQELLSSLKTPPSNQLLSVFSFAAVRVSNESLIKLSKALLFPKLTEMKLTDRIKISLVYYHITSIKTSHHLHTVTWWSYYVTGRTDMDISPLLEACTSDVISNTSYNLELYAILGILKYFDEAKISISLSFQKTLESLMYQLFYMIPLIANPDELVYLTTELISLKSLSNLSSNNAKNLNILNVNTSISFSECFISIHRLFNNKH